MKKYFLSIMILLPSLLFSNTYIVTNTFDSGTGSLREAVNSANSNYGPDNISFNIPMIDAGYNASAGTWTIGLASELPYISGGYTTIDGSTQTTSQGNTNPSGPEIVLYGGDTLDYSFILVSPNNVVKGFIIGGFNYGVLLYNSTSTGNTVSNNYFGVNYNASASFPNQYGIGLASNASGNTILNNVISGNVMGGIGITQANGNYIKGNKIGTNYDGILAIPNPYGIAVDNASGTIIGGTTVSDRNIISGNSSAGIVFNGSGAVSNIVKGNYIGTTFSGNDSLPNANGIILAGAALNTIGGSSAAERNIISGNTLTGITMNGSGTRMNNVKGNYIGISADGDTFISNHTGIMIKSNSNHNIIGGSTSNERNIISGNIEIGVYIESSDSNTVSGNYIGPDPSGSGTYSIGDTLMQANGVEVNTVSKHNTIGGYNAGERNVISGNRVYGMIYYGNVSYNPTIGNYIGTDASGNNAMPNATGICVDGGSNHNPIENNVLSGNISYGIFIVTTGTYYNTMKGNLVGTNAAGTDSVPNDIGILLGGGARFNVIGGYSTSDKNVISGNRYNGIEAADNGTSFNEIIGNYIGTDISGTMALPNKIGIGFSSFPSQNTIDSNLVSGNNYLGIILYDHSDSNTVIRNRIGVAADGIAALGNGSSGIVLGMSASGNFIGKVNEGNIIANHDTAGVAIMDAQTKNNSIVGNAIYSNGLLGIDIFPAGVNLNDAGDIDDGPNDMINFPVIASATYYPMYNYTTVTGTLEVNSIHSCTIHLYISDNDNSGYGEGQEYIGFAQTGNSGNWTVNIPGNYYNASITATATDTMGNTSEFALNTSVAMGVQEIHKEVIQIQMYPNPVSDKLCIAFNVESETAVEIKICNIIGKCFMQKDYGMIGAGDYYLSFYLKSEYSFKPGIYMLQVYQDKSVVSTKKIIIK
jgi:parallel beta-helix repeat protein